MAWQVAVKPEREEKIRKNAHELMRSSEATCRVISAFLGRTGSTVGAIPLARARVRLPQWSFLSVCTSPEFYDSYMTLSVEVKEELRFWAELPTGLSLPITLGESSGTVTTDASEEGLGIWYDGHIISERIPEHYSDFHINVKELLALKRFLDNFPEVTNCVLTWRCDSNTALAALRNEGSTHSWALSVLSSNILMTSLQRNIAWDPVRISGEENLIADAASRFRQVADWSLSDSIVQKIFERLGTPDVDLMASDFSRKAPMFFSWSRADKEAWGIDSLARDVDWNQFRLPYCFPPFPLIQQVLDKCKRQGV